MEISSTNAKPDTNIITFSFKNMKMKQKEQMRSHNAGDQSPLNLNFFKNQVQSCVEY